ncbi:hypothetical protein ASD24_24285 [Paenibacillus sp. Root52]|uniref:hypothetical protein n=1 Tax=Paenibacillus sp. Root52 TaxID=1736552 RepID=UPI0006FE6031|nr:hypothetical protein [Paenibacillus sp. Root52]KQY90920.1 hypothetical protein ASD24_24285 [Paenibacillus sp. Root52]
MSLTRKIDVEGRIVLPISTREILNIDPTCDIEIKESDNGLSLFIHRNYCVFCGATSQTVKFKGHEVCKTCVENIAAESTPLPKQEKIIHEDYRSPAVIKMKELLKKSPNIKQYEMAEILGISKPRVSQLMKKLRSNVV